jgi:hypothetical protein
MYLYLVQCNNGTGQLIHTSHFIIHIIGLFTALVFSKACRKKPINHLDTNINCIHSHLMSVALAKSHLNFQTHYNDSNTQNYYLVLKNKKQERDEEKTSINAVNFYCVQDISAMLKKVPCIKLKLHFSKSV